MVPLINSSQMPGFEKPIDPEKALLDQLYDSKKDTTQEETVQMQKRARDGLFGGFSSKKAGEKKINQEYVEKKQESNIDPLGLLEETEEQQKYTNQEQNKDLEQENNISSIESDSPYFPILKNLTESGHIEEDVFKDCYLKLNKSSKEDGQKEIIELVKTISDSSLKQDILEKFENNTEVDEKNFKKTKFFTDISSLKIDIDSGVGGLEIMLAENYIPIPNIEGEENKDKDVSLCMDTVVNTIISNNNKDFKLQNGVLISNIRKESNINKKYTLLKELYEGDLKYDAKAGGKKYKEQERIKKESLLAEAKQNTIDRIIAGDIINEQERGKKLKDLIAQKEGIIEEGKGIDNFEAEVASLSGGKEDKQNESIEKEQQV